MAKAKHREAPGSRVASKSSPRLKRYFAKRDLRSSGEPGGAAGRAESSDLRYVIQKHDATRLHYDFRLEMDGVLRSWAVPKGLPEKVGAKSLAVEVEDHPLDYGDFEGVIPDGNYGAGTVMLWDRGTYVIEGATPGEAYRNGKLHVRLAGEKCRGAWTLIRMNGKEGERNDWLVIKNSESDGSSGIVAAGRDVSVKTGRTLEEIASSRPSKEPKPRGTPTSAKPKSGLSSKGSARLTSAVVKEPQASPSYVEPMKALGGQVVGDEWLLEIKYDGFRALAIIHEGRAELWSRNEKPLSADCPEIVSAASKLKCRSAVVDGEIVALDPKGRPAFQLLQNRGAARTRPPIHFFAFDLLHLDGLSYLDVPIEQRKETLRELLIGAPDALRFSPVFEVEPAELLEQARKQGLEGIVAKRRGSLYEPGRRSGTWLKQRISRDQEFVIGGYTAPQGGRSHFGALLVGYYDDGTLKFAGKVGTGFNAEGLAKLHRQFAPLLRKERPFSGPTIKGVKGVTWLEPKLVCQVKFSEWTRDGLLRQPVFLGLRPDKEPDEVVRETSSA